jgi:hypothetical protein
MMVSAQLRGLACGVTSGHSFVLVEHELSIRYGYTRRPIVLVDAADIGARGADLLVVELKEALGLSDVDVTWDAGRDTEQAAARFAAEVRRRSPKT